MVSKAIESAQEKIEGFNFDSRKHILEYDDVLNHQRNIIYKKRKEILSADDEFIRRRLDEIYEVQGMDKEELKKKEKEMGENFIKAQKMLMLQAIDMHWMGHLEAIDYIKSSIRLRAYGQRDPLVEYKNEASRMFKQLEAMIDQTIAQMATKIGMQVQQSVKSETQNTKQIKNHSNKVGRNDPCPCGSGKKYKRCHGA